MFFPIEDQSELARLRSFMSPFMISIRKCFSTIYNIFDHTQVNRVCDDVLRSISSAVNPELLTGLNRIIARPENITIGLEQDALRRISLRYFMFQEKSNLILFKLVPTP